MKRSVAARLPRLLPIAVAIWGGVIGCGSDIAAPNSGDGQVFMRLKLDKPAVTLSKKAPYNTIQLSAVALRGNGEVIEGVQPIFRTSDENITVTETGLVTALEETTLSTVIATVQYEGITQVDTAFVTVALDTVPSPIQTFSVNEDPFSPVVTGQPASLSITATNTNGESIGFQMPYTFPVYFESSDPSIATVDRFGGVTGEKPTKEVTITATTTVYGVTRVDSVKITVGYPAGVVVPIGPRQNENGVTIYDFSPNNIYIAAGGSVMFLNGMSFDLLNPDPIDIVFADPSAAEESDMLPSGEGNIAPFKAADPTDFMGAARARRFTRPGSYTFKSELYGTSGVIHVH